MIENCPLFGLIKAAVRKNAFTLQFHILGFSGTQWSFDQ